MSARGRKTERVCDEIDQRSPEENRLGMDVSFAVTLDLHALLLRDQLVEFAELFDRGASIEGTDLR